MYMLPKRSCQSHLNGSRISNLRQPYCFSLFVSIEMQLTNEHFEHICLHISTLPFKYNTVSSKGIWHHAFEMFSLNTLHLVLSYHQGCISCINYPSNKLSFIRRVLNKSHRHNSLGQRLVVVSCVIFRGYYSLFCPKCLMCETFLKHVEDQNHVCLLIQKWSTAVLRKK